MKIIGFSLFLLFAPLLLASAESNNEVDWQFQFVSDQITSDGQDFQNLQPLVKILSEPEGNRLHSILLEVDGNGNILGFSRQSSTDQQNFFMHDLIKGEVVLATASGRNVLLLSCHGCTATSGGALVMRYLHNGIFDTYHHFSMQLRKTNDQWQLFTSNSTLIHQLQLVTNTVFGKTVGIEKIRVNP